MKKIYMKMFSVPFIGLVGKTTMFKKMLLLMTAVLFSVNGLLLAQSSMTVVDLPVTDTDDAIGIDTSNTYTHTIDFGLGGVATINGVDFLPFVDNLKSPVAVYEYTSLQGFGFIVDDTRNPNVNIEANDGSSKDSSLQCDGSSVDLLTDMIFLSKAAELGEGILITLMDLVPGTKYSVRYYYRPWDSDKPRPLTVSGDGASNDVFSDSIQIDIDIDDIDNPSGHYLDYTFVADDNDVTMKFVFHNDNQGPHIYGLTCEILPATGIDSKPGAKPSTFELMQNYPNPFNTQTTIDYQLTAKTNVSLKVFDIIGNEVANLVNDQQAPGLYSVKFDGHNLASGIYIYQLKANEQISQKHMLLLK